MGRDPVERLTIKRAGRAAQSLGSPTVIRHRRRDDR
jgi:hypothetical protein